MLQKLKAWPKTKSGLLVFGLAGLVLAYIFARLALDHGSPFWYLLTLAFLVGALQNLFKFIGSFHRHRRKL